MDIQSRDAATDAATQAATAPAQGSAPAQGTIPAQTRRAPIPVHVRTVTFAHPDAVRLNDRVQLEYAERYGDEGDVTPLDPTMFEPPRGLYLIAYDEHGTPLATGGWRSMDENGEGYENGDAELKRMYVTPEARGLGLARRILAALEDDAKAANRTRMVLETGTKQPEAIALYLSSGYTPAPAKFGHYRFDDLSLCYAKPL